MRRKRGQLTPEDLSVWKQVAQTTTPIEPGSRNIVGPTVPKAVETPQIPRPVLKPGTKKPKPSKTPAISYDLAVDPMAALLQQPPKMDRRKHEKMRRGKLSPDARIDLHGMIATRAHSTLTSFMLSAYARGDRLILVITGKGKAPEIHHGAMSPHRGVLRQSVPQWLALPPLAPLVLQITPASARHGGQGAYYVYLRRNR